MSLKDLFKEEKYKHLSNYQQSALTSSGIESAEYLEVYLKERQRFIPLVDYSLPENFARFGSAEKYYYDTISSIYSTYPYDGSKKEKISWELSASGLDLYVFENNYPRTTGYAVFSTSSLTAIDTSTNYSVWGSYGAAISSSYEFISFNGGPHAGKGNSIYIDPVTGEAHYREDANIYDLSNNRECNLKIGGNDGNTVEFWLKKAAFDPSATQTEVVVDLFTTSSISSSADYGRLTIEMSGHGAATNTLSPFYVTYMSGTSGVSKQNIGVSLTTSSVADDNWHHYSFRFKNVGSDLSVDLFVDGEYNHNFSGGSTVDYVSGTIVGTIGSLATHPSGTSAGAPLAAKGWGKLSGSLDEFRYWKVWRDSKQIQTRWFDQVGGGTNTDDANTHLGLYYKFNEGITLSSSTDSVVLDYSGRISNGNWTGYSTIYSRETGSAIDESLATNFSGSEFKDPIIYAYHPDVQSLLETKRLEGKEYDYRNPSTIYYSLPSWILELHDTNNTSGDKITANALWNLTQIIGSYFDNAANMMKSMPSLLQTDYASGSQKPIPFLNRILESKGFVAPEIFNAIDALENYENRDKNTIYTEKISDIKNLIYQNIYNNLTFINKSKGTEKSFRNLIRCFGIDDQVYKLNIYPNNVDFILEDNFRTVADKFKTINFNTIPNSNATVYQYSSSLNPNTVTFISASKDFVTSTSQEAGLPFSVEANMIFPNRVSMADYHTLRRNDATFRNDYPLMETASLFGMHTADDSLPAETTWNSNDYANFVVRSVKPNQFSDKAKFVLTGTAGGFIPELTSSFIDDVYKDTNWNFLVCLYPEKYPNVNQVSGAANTKSDYVVQFSGIQKITDTVLNEFTVTGSMTADEATKFLASPKRTFIGSHRTNFTGSLRERTDVKLNTIRVWQNKLTMDDLSVHAQDPNNYSIKNPEQNAFLFNDSINRVYVPNKETLLLHWNFDQVSGSDSSGEFIVQDGTSGSIDQIDRYGFLSNISNKQYTGIGFEFAQNSPTVLAVEDIVTAKPNIPEVLASENTVKVMQNDDIYFTKDSRPTFFDLYIEKSPYQNISEEMLKFMSTVVDFNNLIGHPVDRYREEYKALKTLRQLFFQRTDTPDIDKYIEYFKWFDLAVAAMIQKIAPMSSGLDERPLRNIIESHILERNKYQSKFPTYEFKQNDPESSLFGINELLYPWKEGHAQLPFGPANNHAVDFDGTDDFVNLQHPSNLTFTNTSEEYTLSAWIKTTDNNAAIISHARATAGFYGYLLQVFSGDLYAIQGGSSNNIRGDAVNDGQWHHVALVNYDDGGTKKFKLYLDGAQNGPIGTSQNPAIDLSTNTDILIGASRALNNGDTTLHMDGQISEVSIWGTGLSAGQIAEIYNSGQPCNLSNHSAYANLITWIRMGAAHGVSGVTLSDIKGSNNGTMTNFTAPFGVVLTDDLKFCASGKGDEADNCLWWRERVERSNVTITSGDTDIDSDRQEILDVINNLNNATPPNLSDGTNTYQGSTYALRRFARPYKLNVVKEPEIHGGGNASENKKVGFWDSMRKRPTQSTPGEGALLAIEPPDSSLDSFKGCNDNLELNKGKRKFKFSVGSVIDGANEFNQIFKGDLVFPFSLYSSSVTDNPAMSELADFQSNLAITNLHHDNYGPFGDVPMQGPFTEKYVGGRPYRHVMTNFTVDNEQPDEEGERLEGWRLTASAETLDLVNVLPHNPKSVYFREEYAKRPVNIKNIQQLTAPVETNDQATDANGVTKIGNFTNTYEVVMTNGRSINNRYLAESDGLLLGTSQESTAVSGVFDFAIPRRDLTGSNKAIIVNRFSAPGDPSTMSEGFLDLAAAELSIYNALPFRNLSVREPLQALLTDHTNQFGLFSDARTVADFERATWKEYPGGSSSIDDIGADLNYIGTGSFHKVNRNGRKQPRFLGELSTYENLGAVEIETSFDNYFVQHQIPQTDVQYAWITASLIENYTGSALYGFEQPDFSNASLASTDLTFVTASDFGSYYWTVAQARRYGASAAAIAAQAQYIRPIFVDFVGLNTNIKDPLSSSTNTIGAPVSLSPSDKEDAYKGGLIDSIGSAPAVPGDNAILNGVLLHRHGPYGGANWKLYRKDNHPIVRTHRSENRLSFLKPEFVFNDENQQVVLSGSKGSIRSVIEPPVTSKYKQITHRVVDGETKQIVDIDHSYMNNIKFFTDHSDGPGQEDTDLFGNLNLDSSILDPQKNLKTEQQMLDVINYYLYNKDDFDGVEDLNPINGLTSFTTRETIYPKERFTYLDTHRRRNSYENGFWRDSAEIRRERGSQDALSGAAGNEGVIDPYFYGIDSFDNFDVPRAFSVSSSAPSGLTASIWPLDSRENFETNSPGRIKSGSDEAKISVGSGLSLIVTRPAVSASDGAGILQNAVYPYSSYTTRFSLVFGSGIQYSTLLPQYNRRIAGTIAGDTTYEYKFGDTKWEAGDQSGKAPFYDTYDEYVEDIKRVGKDYSIIPEFRISNHMDYYLKQDSFFVDPPEGIYEITGTVLSSSQNSSFIKTYSHSDFIKTFSVVNDFYGDDVDTKNVTLSVDALLKFIPYDGFYPADRSVQVTKLFFDSYKDQFIIDSNQDLLVGVASSDEYEVGDPIPGSNAGIINPVWKTLFAPGILYNSIKSGIAVDYPIHKSPFTVAGTPNKRNSLGYLIDIPRISSSFDARLPFESLYNPDSYFKDHLGIVDSEPHPTASQNLTASLAGNAGTKSYSLAMNNFLASTIDFFLKDKQMTELVSLSEGDDFYGIADDIAGKGFKKDIQYKMRIVLTNSSIASKSKIVNRSSTEEELASFNRNPANVVMYARTGSDPTRRADYYGSSFGPPCNADTSKLARLATDPTGSNADFLFGSASFEPFTPPYYDGYSHIEITYTPEEDGVLGGINGPLDVLAKSTFEYFRDNTSRDNAYSLDHNGYLAADEAMQLSASIDIKIATEFSKKFDNNGNLIDSTDGDSNAYRLAIQPKWESPVLDFKNVNVTLPTIGSGSVARGMWHQYGQIPENKGIFMEIQDIDESEFIAGTVTGSLAAQMGFRDHVPNQDKIGQLAISTKISEAIVAIPFIGFFETGDAQLYPINKDLITEVAETLKIKNISNSAIVEALPNVDPTIIEMVRKMKKYVIPPHLDFLNNPDRDPFAMFIFDFDYTLSRNDLSNIWQNLSPDIGRTAEEKQASLPVDIFKSNQSTETMMSAFSPSTRWMVFKVKQRGVNSMQSKLSLESDDKKMTDEQGLNLLKEQTYSYNWPYDFFSLIELVKIDANITSEVKLGSDISTLDAEGVQEAVDALINTGLINTGEN